MSKRYTMTPANGEPQTFSRKEAAIRAGEKIGEDFHVLSPSGIVVYDGGLASDADDVQEPVEKTSAQNNIESGASDDSYFPADDYVDNGDEDLIGDEPEVEPVAEDDLTEELPRAKKPVDLEKMKERIRMLLAKAENTNFPAEAEAFNEAAEKLMIRLGIERADLESQGKVDREDIVEVQRVFPGNYSISFIPFVYELASGFGNVTVLHRTSRIGLERVAYVIGTRSDVEEFMNLLESMVTQVTRDLHVWQRENRDRRRTLTDMQRFIQHRSFIEAFGKRVGIRLGEFRREAEETVTKGTELVLANKDARRQEWIDEEHGNVREVGFKNRQNLEGALAGDAAGRKADVGSKKVEQ